MTFDERSEFSLIDLLKSLKENPKPKTFLVCLEKKSDLPPSDSRSQEEIIEVVKNTKVFLKETGLLGSEELQDLFLIGTTNYLATSLTEARINNIEEEFEGFCMYMDW